VAPASASGRLYPRRTGQAFVLKSDVPRPWPHGVNIDHSVVLDFDEDRVLANVELLGPMSAWKGKEPVVQSASTAGDIRLGNALVGNSSYDWPVVVSKDVQREMVRVSFGGSEFDRAVGLSATAAALLRNDRLVGFWFSLRR